MFRQLNNFKNYQTVHFDTLILQDENLNSSARFVYFMQNYLEKMHPYILE
jgi:hypothetical protein